MIDRVAFQPEGSRFVLLRDDEQGERELGFAHVREEHGTLVFDHTVIDPEVRERGLGSRLVAGALELVRAERAERVVAECPFVVRYLEEHPEFADLTSR